MESLQLAMIFRDHCVLQQNKPCKIWGKAMPFAHVKIWIQNKDVCVDADSAGAWTALLPVLTGSRDETLLVRSQAEEVAVRHVGVGEVWLLGGQSNMEFHMRYDKDYPKEAARSRWEDVRFFDVPEVSYAGQEQDFDYTRFGRWRTANACDLEYFSAVGYYFALHIAQRQSVPVGLIGCNWGGTTACTWADEESLLPAGKVWLEEYEQTLQQHHLGLAGDYVLHPEWNTQAGEREWETRAQYEQAYRKHPGADRGNPFADVDSERLLYGMDREEQKGLLASFPPPQEGDVLSMLGPFHPNRPGGLYRTMVKQVAPFSVRGVLWYQGESDCAHAEIYAEMFSAVIRSWRDLWQECLPFFCVQLAPFGRWMMCEGTQFSEIRAAQMAVANAVEQVYIASSSDVGALYDVHPKEKKPIGDRLALLALHYAYGQGVEAEAPRYRSHRWEGSTCVLSFEYTYGGLYAVGDPAQEVTVCRRDGAVVPPSEYSLTIAADEIAITFHTEPTNTYRILYAVKDYYQVNLYNHAHLPLFPFAVGLS